MSPAIYEPTAAETRIAEVTNRLRAQTAARPIETAQPRYPGAPPESYPPAEYAPRYEDRVLQAPAAPERWRSARSPRPGGRPAIASICRPGATRYAAKRAFRRRSFRSRATRFALRPAPEDAANRRFASPGAKPDPRASRRTWGGAASRSQAPFAPRKACLVRHQPPGRSGDGFWPARQASARAAASTRADPPAAAAGSGPCRVRQTCAASASPAKSSATGGGRAWPRRLSNPGDRRGPARDSRFPAAPIELTKLFVPKGIVSKHLMGTVGPGIQNANETNRYSWYAAMLVTF